MKSGQPPVSRADQPRISSGQISRGEKSPALTYRAPSVKNYTGDKRSQRDYTRR